MTHPGWDGTRSRAGTIRRLVVLAGATAALSGCFRYVPTDPEAVPAGARVRVHLAPEAQARVARSLGRRVEATIDGTLAARPPHQLSLEIPVGTRQEGFFRTGLAQNVQISQRDVVGLEVRRFSRGRTLLLIGAAAGGAASLVASLVGTTGNGSSSPSLPPESEIRIPLPTAR